MSQAKSGNLPPDSPLLNLPEVWILDLEWEPDFPSHGGWATHGVYTTWGAACRERDLQIKNNPGYIKAWNIKRWEVLP